MAKKMWNMASYSDMKNLESRISGHYREEVVNLIIMNLQYIGEKCVAIARDKTRANTWGDRTGNLRSSIGYVVQNNGVPVVMGPKKMFSGEDGKGEKGPASANRLMKMLRGTKQSGVVLIVVAGMDYAEYVELVHGKDVLASSWLEGQRLAEKLLGKLFEKKEIHDKDYE